MEIALGLLNFWLCLGFISLFYSSRVSITEELKAHIGILMIIIAGPIWTVFIIKHLIENEGKRLLSRETLNHFNKNEIVTL